jgi:hypothetical protein
MSILADQAVEYHDISGRSIVPAQLDKGRS